MASVKNPTQWQPPSGSGYVVNIGVLNLVDNSGNFLVDNSQNPIVTTPTYAIPQFDTTWVETGV